MKKANSKEKMQKVVIAIAQAYNTNNTALTSRVEAIVMPDEQPLPKELQECLESWGKTPIEEPEFFELTQTATFEDLKDAAIKDLNIDDFNSLDVATFADRVYKRVTDKIDEDGKYKTTANIDKVKLPRTTQLKALKKLVIDDAGEEKVNKEIFKIAGVKEKDISEWEANLIKDLTYSFVQAVDRDVVGNYSDRTPFARYIKNI